MLQAECKSCGKIVTLELNSLSKASKKLYAKGWRHVTNESLKNKQVITGLLCPKCVKQVSNKK